MSPEHRYLVAFVAASIDGRVFTAVYDHDAAKHVAIGGYVLPNQLELYDAGAERRYEGPPSNLYDEADGTFISFQTLGPEFSGYDHASGRHFSGTVSGDVVQLYDFETERYHAFHLS